MMNEKRSVMKAWIFCLVVGLVLGTGSGAQGAAPAGKEVKVDGVTYELAS